MSEPQIISQKEEPHLYKRSVKGAYWVISLQFAIIFLGFAKSLIVANFFLLHDLGIISAAIMMMEVLTTFTQTGFEAALVQKKGDVRDYLDTAWTTGVIKGIVLFVLLYVSAPLLASLKIPEDRLTLAVAVFRVMGISFILSGCRNIGTIYFQKDMEFHKTFLLTLASVLVDILLSILLVIVFRSIWGVIVARLLSTALNCAGSYVLSDYRPRLRLVPEHVRELWKFGKSISGQNILGYLLETGIDFFVWFYLGAARALPLYRYAYQFSNLPAAQISSVVAQVSFPAYSKIQHDLIRLKEAYLKVQKVTSVLCVPIAFLIFILGPEFVYLFLPDQMAPMVPALQILAAKGLLKSLGATRGPLFQALGQPQLVWHFQWMRLVVLVLTIFPFTKIWGITGTALSSLIVNVLIDPIGFFISCKMLRCSWRLLLRASILPVYASLFMCAAVALLKFFLLPQLSYLFLGIMALTGISIYVVALWQLDSVFKYGYLEIIREQIAIIRQRFTYR